MSLLKYVFEPAVQYIFRARSCQLELCWTTVASSAARRLKLRMRDQEAKRSFERSDDPWRSVPWVADYLTCSTRDVYRRAAELGGVKYGARLLFKASEIDRRMDQLRLDRPRRR